MSKQAYIETELGLLPSDWNIDTLGEMFRPFTSASFSREEMDAQSGVACVHYGDIHKRFGNIVDLDIEKLPLISEEKARAYKLLKDGDLLLADASEDDEGIGKSIVVIVGSHKVIAGLHTIPLRPRKDLDTRFPSYLFAGKLVKRQIEKLSEGTKVNSISFAKIKDVFIPFPPTKEEQSRIASALFDIDTLIRDLDRTIEKKQNIRQGAMEQLLSGKKRLPGFKGEWEDVELSEFGRMISGVSYKPEQAYNILSSDSTILLRSTNVQEGRIYMGDLIFVHNSCIKDVQIMRHGDILICTANGSRALVGKSALFLQAERCTFGAFMSVFRCYDSQFSSFVYYLFQSRTYRRMLEDILSGSAINNLNASQVEELVFRVPSDTNEIFAIADLLTAMDDEIAMLQLERTKYANIRSGMMDDLLSGTKRL